MKNIFQKINFKNFDKKLLFPYLEAFFIVFIGLLIGDETLYFMTILFSMFIIPFTNNMSGKQVAVFFMILFVFMSFSSYSLKKESVEYVNIRTPEKIVISNGKYNISVVGDEKRQVLEKSKLPKCEFVVADKKEYYNLFGKELTKFDKDVFVCKEKLKELNQ